MQTRHAVEAVAPRVWRDLAALAAEAVAIGVLFSLLLALAVLVMTRARPDDSFAGIGEPSAPALVAAAPRGKDRQRQSASSGEDLSAGASPVVR